VAYLTHPSTHLPSQLLGLSDEHLLAHNHVLGIPSPVHESKDLLALPEFVLSVALSIPDFLNDPCEFEAQDLARVRGYRIIALALQCVCTVEAESFDVNKYFVWFGARLGDIGVNKEGGGRAGAVLDVYRMYGKLLGVRGNENGGRTGYVVLLQSRAKDIKVAHRLRACLLT